MSSRLFLCVLMLFASISLRANAQIQTYDAKATRAQLEALAHRPQGEVVVVGEPQSAAAKAFLDFYLNEILPASKIMYQQEMKYYAAKLLKDSGSYDTLEERDAYDADQLAALNYFNAHAVDQEWTAKIAKWNELSQGLSGSLVNSARSAHRSRQLESFPREAQATLDEMARLQQNWEIQIDLAPDKKKLGPHFKKESLLIRLFNKGALTFEQAKEKLVEMNRESPRYSISQFAIEKSGDTLNQLAIMRTKAAKTKNFSTWAEYQLASTGEGYDESFRGPRAQLAFLESYIGALQPLHRHFIEKRKTELGLGEIGVTRSVRKLLSLPGLEMLEAYFPKESITPIWTKSLIDSGFSPETLAQILVDDEARPQKFQTGAYMFPVLAPETENFELDAATLSWNYGSPDMRGRRPGLAYILQNYEGTGVKDLYVAYHEGGHALEHILAYQGDAQPRATGYSETPSMTMERFTHDAEFLWANARPVGGKTPTLDETRTFTENERLNSIIDLTVMATQAWLDTKLWDYDYTAPGAQTFLERIQILSREARKLEGLEEDPSRLDPMHAWLTAPHFVGGWVMYIGYTYAEISARMMTQFISTELEKSTGRRSWNQQPGLAKIFTEPFFQQGWKHLFPTNVEKITGRKFDPADVLSHMAQELGCETLLGPKPAK